jgi:hypothetical protein
MNQSSIEIKEASSIDLILAIMLQIAIGFMMLWNPSSSIEDSYKHNLVLHVLSTLSLGYMFYFVRGLKKQRAEWGIIITLLMISVYFMALSIWLGWYNGFEYIRWAEKDTLFVIYKIPVYVISILTIIYSLDWYRNNLSGTLKKGLQLLSLALIVRAVLMLMYTFLLQEFLIEHQLFKVFYFTTFISILPLAAQIYLYVIELHSKEVREY